jgi:hypothetical protein
MRRSAKILAATIAVTAAAAAGVLLARQGRDPVVETQPRFTASVSAKQNSVPAQSRISLQPNTYLEPMAEPKPSAAAVTKQIPEPAKPAEPAAEPVPALAPPPVADPQACALGSRPIGDCNCLDEAHDKLALRLHPTQACLDEESKRLGHQVLVTNGQGIFELAGIKPPEAAEPVAMPAIKRELPPQVQPAVVVSSPPALSPEVQQLLAQKRALEQRGADMEKALLPSLESAKWCSANEPSLAMKPLYDFSVQYTNLRKQLAAALGMTLSEFSRSDLAKYSVQCPPGFKKNFSSALFTCNAIRNANRYPAHFVPYPRARR